MYICCTTIVHLSNNSQFILDMFNAIILTHLVVWGLCDTLKIQVFEVHPNL